MIKDIQLTLYEIIGYLIPGLVNLTGLALFFWGLFLPTTTVTVDLHTGELWIAFLVTAYIAGHMAQALGNLSEKWLKPIELIVMENATKDRFPQSIIEACKKKAKELTGADISDVPARWLYRVCDDAVVRSGRIGEREIFVYREGFYRGMCVSSLV